MARVRPAFEARLSKFDPSQRDADGAFRGDGWTHFAQIGETFRGVRLTPADYERVETAYVETLVAMLAETGVRLLRVEGLERRSAKNDGFRPGQQMLLRELPAAFRRVLREEVWCRFANDRALVHFGWDFLTHVGLPREPRSSLGLAAERGLFVEAMRSPYV